MTQGFLWLAGLGLDPPRTMPQGILNALLQADECWIEAYTNSHPRIDALIRILNENTPCKTATRRMVEENLLDELRKGKKILLTVLGDPLGATTHVSLLADVREAGIPVTIIPANSVFTSIAKTGVSLYRVGRTVTIPYPRGSWQPTSWQDQLHGNMRQNLHTFLLLDIITDPADMSLIKPPYAPTQQGTAWLMTLTDAIRLLQPVLPEDAFLISCTRLDQEGEILLHGLLRDYARLAEHLPRDGPHCLIHVQPDSMEDELIRRLTLPLTEWLRENTA